MAGKGSYRDPMVWQSGMELAVHTYGLTESFPRREHFGLAQQLRRSVISIPSNIAEGHGRRRARQRYTFLEIALGSTFEAETQLDLTVRLGFATTDEAEPLIQMTRRIGRGLSRLLDHVESQISEHNQ
jgi:four helix bundle protein